MSILLETVHRNTKDCTAIIPEVQLLCFGGFWCCLKKHSSCCFPVSALLESRDTAVEGLDSVGYWRLRREISSVWVRALHGTPSTGIHLRIYAEMNVCICTRTHKRAHTNANTHTHTLSLSLSLSCLLAYG